MPIHRLPALLLIAACGLSRTLPAVAQSPDAGATRPAAAPWWGVRASFAALEAGTLDKRVLRASLGFDDPRASAWLGQRAWLGRPSLHWEFSVGAWHFRNNDDRSRSLAAVGLRPVLTWGDRLFAEAGLGVNWLSDHFEHDGRRFSSSFQFAEHLGLGWRFTPDTSAVLRFEHVSNAGLSQPNPGTNTVLLMLRHRLH